MSATQLCCYKSQLRLVETRREKSFDDEEKKSLLRDLIQITEKQIELQDRLPLFQSPELSELEDRLEAYCKVNGKMQDEYETLSNDADKMRDNLRFFDEYKRAIDRLYKLEAKMTDNMGTITLLNDKISLTREINRLEDQASVSNIVKKLNTWKLNHERLRTTITDLLDCDLSSESISEQQEEDNVLMNSELYFENKLKECRESIWDTKQEYHRFRQMSNAAECEAQKELFDEECEELEIKMRPTLDMIRLLESQLKLIRETKQLYKRLQKQNEQDGKLKVVRVTPELLDQLDEHFSQLGKNPEENEKKWTEFFPKMAPNVVSK